MNGNPISFGLFAAATLGCVLLTNPANTKADEDDTAIKPIIPHEVVGRQSCFEGTFADKALDMTSWPSYAVQAAAMKGDGKAKAAAVTRALPSQSVSQVALHLTYTNETAEGGSWDFNFTLAVTSPSLDKTLYAHSGCAWSGYDPATDKHLEPPFKLGCWIECDGGGFGAARVPGTNRLALNFYRLKMQSGCEGGGLFSVGDSEPSQAVEFRLEPTTLDRCAPLAEWAKE